MTPQLDQQSKNLPGFIINDATLLYFNPESKFFPKNTLCIHFSNRTYLARAAGRLKYALNIVLFESFLKLGLKMISRAKLLSQPFCMSKIFMPKTSKLFTDMIDTECLVPPWLIVITSQTYMVHLLLPRRIHIY